jgi:hypothetical protein
MASFNYLSYDSLKVNVKNLIAAVKSKHELTKSDNSETRAKREAQVTLIENSIDALDAMLLECNSRDEDCQKFVSMALTGTLLHIRNQIKEEYEYKNSYSAVAFILSALSSPESSALYAGIHDAAGITANNQPDKTELALMEACTKGHLAYLATHGQQATDPVATPADKPQKPLTTSDGIKIDTKSLILMKTEVHPHITPNMWLTRTNSKAALEIKESKERSKTQSSLYRR